MILVSRFEAGIAFACPADTHPSVVSDIDDPKGLHLYLSMLWLRRFRQQECAVAFGNHEFGGSPAGRPQQEPTARLALCWSALCSHYFFSGVYVFYVCHCVLLVSVENETRAM